MLKVGILVKSVPKIGHQVGRPPRASIRQEQCFLESNTEGGDIYLVLRGIFIIILQDCMHITQQLKQLTKFCAHAMYKARRKLYRACDLRQRRDFMSNAIELAITTHIVLIFIPIEFEKQTSKKDQIFMRYYAEACNE